MGGEENLEKYIPRQVKIERIKEETPEVKTFFFPAEELPFYLPGQFVELSVFGEGEAPLSISSSPTEKDFFSLSVKRMGRVTTRLHRLEEGKKVGIRGPYGNGFPLERIKGKNIVFVGGGIGLAPLRSLLKYALDRREEFGSLLLLYGARTPQDLVFREELLRWEKEESMEVFLTVDREDKKWKGRVGVVTTLFEATKLPPEERVALICGPEIMIRFVVKELTQRGFEEEEIILSLERHMKCGVGKCGHCNIGQKYVCLDGPVFTLKQIRELREEFF